jgi:hypothetical protein
MIELITKAYTFEELSDEAKQVAIEDDRDYHTFYDWWDLSIEEYKNALSLAGFENAEIAWSGFWNQGDGASFTANINIHTLNQWAGLGLKKSLCDIINEYCCPKVSRGNSHYYHERTCSIDYDGLSGNCRYARLEEAIDKVISRIENIRLEWCDKIYKGLEKEYDYLTSDVCISESLIANECYFTKDGKRIKQY